MAACGEFAEQFETYSKLLDNGWIERRGDGHDAAYRITSNGLAAKIRPVKI